MTPPPRPPGATRRGRAALVAGGLALGLLLASHPRWAAGLGSSYPDPSSGYAGQADVRLVIWTQAWVAHALLEAPTRLYDANINYPVRYGLTASEHYFGTQVVALPVYWLTRNPVLATNLTVALTYAVSAAATAALLAGWGAGLLVSTLAGLLAAFGATRVPLDLPDLLQHPNSLPLLVWLAFDVSYGARERERPLWFGLALVLAFLWSFYTAILTLALVAVLTLDLGPSSGLRCARSSATSVAGWLRSSPRPYAARTSSPACGS